MINIGPARKGERRDVLTAFVTLFALIASHALLETARDALFLAKVPATNLPWVYLAIAALSLGTVKVDARLTGGRSPRRVLAAVSLSAGALTLGFFALHRALGIAGFYALYVWSGLLTTLLLVHFWDLLGARFTITQAKRLYGFIGAGGVAGAIAGSGAAGGLARFIGPEKLVLISAIGFALAGLLPLLFTEQGSVTPVAPAARAAGGAGGAGGARGARGAESAPSLGESFGVVAHDPYARRLVATLFVATVCLTVSDYVFKSTVAELVPRKELAAFLGSVYFGSNILSLVAQLWLVGWILKRVSLGAALGVLPALLAATALGVTVSATLVAVVALKAADGSLRYSLHSTTAELLFFPFGDTGRRVKAAADLVAQRGGQVLASLAILGLSVLHADPRRMALGLVFLSCVWVGGALGLRKPYVAIFRARSRAARANQLDEFPELDVASLETVLRALESDRDAEVLAALAVLERENKAHLVPALLLHHPSEPVVLRVLGILAESNRKSAVPIINRIAGHPSPNVRAAAVATLSVLDSDLEKLRELLASEESAEIRGTVLVNLIVSGAFERDERDRQTEALLRDCAPRTLVAFAEAIGRRSAPGFDDVLRTLLGTRDSHVRRAAVTAMGAVRTPSLLPDLAGALGAEDTRGAAEHALAAYGDEAFDVLRARLEDTSPVSTTTSLRWRIPAAMALCSPEKTMTTLLAWLPAEADGTVRFGILLVLERLVRRYPTLPINKAALHESIRGTILRAYWYVDMRQQLARGATQDTTRKTPGHELLADLLRDKEANARGRLFRLLGLLHPSEDLVHIYRGLQVSKELRATSVELVENILREPMRTAVLGLIDDCVDSLRLPRGAAYHRPRRFGYPELLAHLEACNSSSVQEVARFHAAELASASTSAARSAEVA
jgi:AAA family ATP:ADP antiporter